VPFQRLSEAISDLLLAGADDGQSRNAS
jgi:hypothetical protein